MIRPQRYFPWKIGRQVFFWHFLFVLSTLIVTGFSLRYFVYEHFNSSGDPTKALGEFDRQLTSLFVFVLLTALVYHAIITFRLLKPLGRLIQRARELRRLDTPITSPLDEEEMNEEPGEWFDLEKALHRIHRELRQKTFDLSREREELSAIIGSVSDAILAVKSDETPLFYNSQFALLFGVRSDLGREPQLAEFFRAPEVLEAFHSVLKTGQAQRMAASIHTSNHMNTRHFVVSVAPLKITPENPTYGAVGVFHDITELKQAEQIRIEFVANASHELRTPLTSIKGYVETLRGDFKEQRLQDAGKFLDIVSRNVDRLIFIVNDLLDLSAIESGADLQKVQVNTREVTEAVFKQLETRRAQKGQILKAHFATETVVGDAQRIEQILLNLVHNAIKYIPENRKIEVFWDATSRHETVLRVKDNGPGILPEHQARLFERFYRVDVGRSREQGGTGLGLAIVKHIMLKHGGRVELKSKIGEGAEFACVFPEI